MKCEGGCRRGERGGVSELEVRGKGMRGEGGEPDPEK